jgi:hypothetical protein
MSSSRPVDGADTQPRRIRDLFSQRNLGTVYLASSLELLCWLAKPTIPGTR